MGLSRHDYRTLRVIDLGISTPEYHIGSGWNLTLLCLMTLLGSTLVEIPRPIPRTSISINCNLPYMTGG